MNIAGSITVTLNGAEASAVRKVLATMSDDELRDAGLTESEINLALEVYGALHDAHL